MNESCHIPDALLATLRDARHVCVLTGAGVSAESGVPTFREAQDGLWADYDPLQLATPEGFLSDPELVWSWYRWRRELVAEVELTAEAGLEQLQIDLRHATDPLALQVHMQHQRLFTATSEIAFRRLIDAAQ